MKKKKWLLSLVMVVALTGCGNKEVATSVDEPELEMVPITQEIGEQEKVYKLVEEDFKDFFDQYFSFTDEEILKLNQVRNTIDEDYWNNLRQNYSTLIKSKLDKYLAPDVITRIAKQYLPDQLNMPKWVLLNEYAVSGHAKVDYLKIRSTRDLGDKMIYEISVVTNNACYPAAVFNEKYGWSNELGYWEEKVEGETYEEVDELLQQEAVSARLEENRDEMKIEQLFWITVKKQDDLKITQISNVELWGIDADNKQQLLDTQYITRLPYKQQATLQESAMINKVFDYLMNASKDDMIYYDKAYDTSATAFIQMWSDIGLINEISVDEAHYLTEYPKSITPYKDEIRQIEMMSEEVECIPSVYSTKNHPRYIVVIPVEALLNNNQIVYYNYKYFVGMEKGKIQSIQFLEMEENEEAVETTEETTKESVTEAASATE